MEALNLRPRGQLVSCQHEPAFPCTSDAYDETGLEDAADRNVHLLGDSVGVSSSRNDAVHHPLLAALAWSL